MKRHLLLQILLSLIFLTDLYPRPVQTEIKTLETGAIAPDFSLRGIDDKIYSLKDFSKSPVLVVIFSCNHCPTAQAYEDRIK